MKVKGYLGLDIGSISTKGAVIDGDNNILAEGYLWTKGNPIEAVRELLILLSGQLDGSVSVEAGGTTGSARKLAGKMIGAAAVKNEITAHAVGTLTYRPDVRTIFEIGGQDSKIILLQDGVVVDYAMNTLCAAGTGAFLSSQAQRLGVKIEDIGAIALKSQSPVAIAARCTVFAETDMVHKAQIGHKKEDLIAGLCQAVVGNYLSNVAKGKSIKGPIVFQGGVSKNIGVVRAFERAVEQRVDVMSGSHLMGAIGAAVLARRSAAEGRRGAFDFSVADMRFETFGSECKGCANRCETVCFYRNGELLDTWGNRCPKGAAQEDIIRVNPA